MADADQAEQTAIISGSAIYDAGIHDQRVAGAMDDFEPIGVDAEADWHRQDLEVDSAVGSIHEEISSRAEVMGSAYPFEISNSSIVYKPSKTGFYEFCLAISLASSLTKGKFAHLPRLFERSVTALVKIYFGDHTEAMHVGTPRDPNVGRTFKDAMTTLNGKSSEWVWSPYPDLPGDPQTTGDEGMDFVVWKETLDKRSGNLFIIGQCACGDDWHTKLGDVDLGRLCKWFHPLSYAKPVRAFSTPRHIATSWLPDALARAGLVFDRARLCITAERQDNAALAALEKQYRPLSEMVFSKNATSATTTESRDTGHRSK